MKKNNIWKSVGIGLFVGLVTVVFNKIERSQRYEENTKKYLAGYYDNATLKNGKITPNAQPIFIPPTDTWTNYEISNAFTISVPNTVELRKRNDMYTQEVKDVGWHGYKIDLSRITFQQKELSKIGSKALETYCRIIIDYAQGNSGDFYKATEVEELNADDIRYLQNQVKQGCESTGFHTMGEVEVRWIRIGNIYGLEIAYVRSGTEDRQVQVYTYSFFNNDETVTMTLSYWVKDREIWEQDFHNLVRTFAWNKLS